MPYRARVRALSTKPSGLFLPNIESPQWQNLLAWFPIVPHQGLVRDFGRRRPIN